LTARSCKRFSGFTFNARHEEQGGAGVTDALIPLALFALSGEKKPDILTSLDEHPETKHPLDAVHGFFRRGIRAEHIGQPQELLGLRTHTGINYETGTVHSSILYNRQILQEGGMFWGCWWIDETLWEAFRAFTEEVAEHGVRLGNNRTRGLGLVRFNPYPMDEEPVAVLRSRVAAFTDLFKQQAEAIGIEAASAYYVPLLCTSDMILHDPLLRARLQLHGADLAACGIDAATLVFHAASTTHVQSWNSLWGLPKADAWAIGMGSVFLFALSQGDDATFSALQQLEQQGLGARRAEGFGMVSVANLFHIELAGGQYR
jgi:CRISPR-associated Csx10 family RAMP protein